MELKELPIKGKRVKFTCQTGIRRYRFDHENPRSSGIFSPHLNAEEGPLVETVHIEVLKIEHTLRQLKATLRDGERLDGEASLSPADVEEAERILFPRENTV